MTTSTTDYEINGDVHGPVAAERAMRQAADALGLGQAGALDTLRSRLTSLGVAGASPQLLAQINDELVALREKGHKHADEFKRQVQIMRDKIAANPALARTQAGGWLDPAKQ
ncbi:hypothetical protein ACU61A_41080 [Pseudonocardia sichuanensis]